jgi:hypothetical protein
VARCRARRAPMPCLRAAERWAPRPRGPLLPRGSGQAAAAGAADGTPEALWRRSCA